MRSPTFTIISRMIYCTVFITLMFLQNQAQAPTPTTTPDVCDEHKKKIAEYKARNQEPPPSTDDFVCVYKRIRGEGDTTNHEPPIGFGGGSAFFDIPCGIKLKRQSKKVDGYHKYKVEKVKENEPKCGFRHLKYTQIDSVLVMTEEERAKGEVGLSEYHLKEGRFKAELRVWLADRSNADTSGNADPDIIIGAEEDKVNEKGEVIEGEGYILSLKRLSNKKRGKVYRNYRYHRSERLRVVKWQLYDPAEPGKGTIKDFSDSNDDLYYLYIEFGHADPKTKKK